MFYDSTPQSLDELTESERDLILHLRENGMTQTALDALMWLIRDSDDDKQLEESEHE